ncbi:class I SAM-dependent methyltransferase [Enterovibrio makurazakiensis]|uniref:class I SAM-dependent methyltransferase n=1 Tax=Enterovibrio makurazakiensis TaxID=2910232 RepID=UPI003D23A162
MDCNNKIDEIHIIHPSKDESSEDYNASGLDAIYGSENTHFWFKHRKEYIFKSISSFVKYDDKIIEVGAGTGGVTRYLMSKGYREICVGELHYSGLMYAKSYGIKNCYQFDLYRSPFVNKFDSVFMFDVLEHLEDPDLALTKVHMMLREQGTIALTVPAHKWLWSRDDKIAGHKKRYTKALISMELEKSGFEVITSRYFFKLIVPLLYLRTLIAPDSQKKILQSEYEKEVKINKIVNGVLFAICKFENIIERFLPNSFGGSIFVVGRKI